MDHKLKVGLLGLGRIGKVHLENLVYRTPMAEVVAVSNPSIAAHAFAHNLGIKNTYQKSLDVIHHPEVEAVIICSPTNSHFEYIQQSAKAGKHIFCEKPLDMTIAAIEEMVALAQQANIKLQVGFNRRFDANFQKIQQQVAAGKIGKPHILKITSRDPNPPSLSYLKGSGGLFMDMTIHDFDMARFIVGSEVVEVFAKGAVLVDEQIGQVGDIDTAAITLTFENGCIGTIDNSRKSSYGYDQRLEIFGSKGMSRINNTYPENEVLYNEEGVHRNVLLNFFMDRYTQSYCNEINDFIKAIQKNQPVPVNAEDALKATKIALAANESLRLNRPVLIK